MKIKCLYHANCADGFTAAWAFRTYLKHDFSDADVEYIPCTYGRLVPDIRDSRIVTLDFSYPADVLQKLADRNESVLVPDHHKTAQEQLSSFPVSKGNVYLDDSFKGVRVLFDMDRSGAGITWDYFHSSDSRPAIVSTVEDRDLWRFALPHTREKMAAIFSYEYTFEDWDIMNMLDVHGLIVDGRAIERKHFKDIKEFLKVGLHYKNIGGTVVPALNRPYHWSSDAGHIMAQDAPFAVCYTRIGSFVKFSLRSRSDGGADVSEVAKQFGGGGHKNAAGFEIPIEKLSEWF